MLACMHNFQLPDFVKPVYAAGPAEDYVDLQSNVDGVADKGTHSSFTNQKATDSTFDTMTEADQAPITGNSENFVDNNSSNVDSHTGHGTHSSFPAMQAGPDSTFDTLTEANTGGTSTTLTNPPSATTGTWTNPTYAYADDSSYTYITSATPSATQTYSGYGFSIPSDASITQVRVRYDAWSIGTAGLTSSKNPTANTGGTNPWTNPTYGYTSNNQYATAVATIPTYRAIGTAASGAGAITVGLPSGMSANDIVILVASTIAGGSITITTDGSVTPWTAVSGSPIDVTGGEKLYVWWGRWSSGTTGPTLTPGGDHCVGRTVAYYRCYAGGSPIDVSATGTETTSDTSFNFATGLTSTYNNELAIVVCSTGYDGASTAQFGSWANTALTSLAERMDNCVSTGGGGGFGLEQGARITAGTIGTWTATLAQASPKAYIAFTLKATNPSNIFDQIYGTFGITGNGGTITKVEIGYEAYSSVAQQLDLYTSSNGGSTWNAIHTTANLGTSDPNAYTYIDVTSDTTWTWTLLNDANFKYKVVTHWLSGTPTWYVDALVVRITYTGINDEQIRVDVSWDGGTNWSSKQTTDLSGTETTYWYDVTGNTSWTPEKLANEQLQVRVDAYTVGDTGEVRLDWIPVEVTYTPANYELDLEFQWTTADFAQTSEYLCIYTGTVNAEALKVDIRSESSWVTIINPLLVSQWNNVSIGTYLTSETITFRFLGETETGDTTQSSWQIDVAIIHVWSVGVNYELELEEQFTDVEYSRTYEELCIYMGTTDAEDIKVYVWITSNSSWVLLANDLTANSWNNISVTSYLIDSTFTIKFVDGTQSSDSVQSTWQKDCALLHTWSLGYNLNLRVRDWDLTDSISGALVYKDTDVLTSNGGGWANWTLVTGTVAVKVKYFGFWINGTFQVEMTEDKTIDVRCRLYDVTVTVQENVQSAYLVGANVTVFNGTSTYGNRIKTGITGNNGQVALTNLPNNTLTFTQYGKSDWSLVIGNATQLVSTEDQSITLTSNQNNLSIQDYRGLIGIVVGVIIPLKRHSIEKCLKRKVLRKKRWKKNG